MRKLDIQNIYLGALLSLAGALVYILPAQADNCGSLSDCFYTANAAVNAAFALVIVGIIIRIFINLLPKNGHNSNDKGSSYTSFEGEHKSQEIRAGFIPKLILPVPLAKAIISNTTTPKIFGHTWDPVTDQRIKQLDQRLQQPAIDFINNVESQLDVQLRVTDSYRSIEEQNEIYASGRTKPGPIRTNAPAGLSYHNYRRAIDVAVIKDGKSDYTKPISEDIAKIGEQEGFSWGGRWPEKKRDYPHFEMSFGQSVDELHSEYLKSP